MADDATVLVRSRAHEAIDLLHLDHVALQARHLGDAGDLALAVGKAGELHDDVDRAGNLAADRGDRHRHTGHAQHLFEAADGVAWRVGVDGGHRTFMAGVHRLQHVERFLTSALAENHTVRAHAQRVLDQVALPDLAMPFHVGGTRLHPSDVRLLQLQFGGVLDRDQALVLRNEGRQGVQHGRLAGAGTA